MSHPLPALTPYAPRTIRWLGRHEAPGATLKVYGIHPAGGVPTDAAMAAARRVADAWLAAPRGARTAGGVDWAACPEHGLGSLVVHQGREALFVVLDVWLGENMMRHRVWAAPLNAIERLEPLEHAEAAFCVWELAVIQHERAAWLRHVLTPEGRSDREAYLDDVLEGEV